MPFIDRKIKQLRNYTTAQVEALFESDENNIVGVNHSTDSWLQRKLEEFYRVVYKQHCNAFCHLVAQG